MNTHLNTRPSDGDRRPSRIFLRHVALLTFTAFTGFGVESLAESDELWVLCTPQALKSPVALELRHNPLHTAASLSSANPRVLTSKTELGEKLTRSLAGRIRGVLRSGATSAVLIDGRCLRPGQELAAGQSTPTEASTARARLKAVEDDRLIFLVPQGQPEGEQYHEAEVMLDPLLHAR